MLVDNNHRPSKPTVIKYDPYAVVVVASGVFSKS